MWWVGPVFMLAFWVLVITGGVFLTRFLVKQGWRHGREDSALEILKRRYALGEINKEEYEEKRRDLA
jgi:putative membrane protein